MFGPTDSDTMLACVRESSDHAQVVPQQEMYCHHNDLERLARSYSPILSTDCALHDILVYTQVIVASANIY